MSYASLLEENEIRSQYLAILSPKIQVSDWVLDAGSVYKSDFDLGQVTTVEVDGSGLNEGSSPTLSAGQFYYDSEGGVLYVRTASSADPSSNFVVVTFDLYISTFDKYWYRDPLDVATDTVYWEPLISRPPNLKQSTSDVIFGFMPKQTSNITINNFEHAFERLIYDCSFNSARIKIYHLLGDLEVGNIKQVYNGFMAEITYDQETIQIKCFDQQDTFNNEWRNPGTDESFYTSTLFPELDPSFEGRPIRYVYGKTPTRSYAPVNVDYEDESPTTSDNRVWAVMSGHNNLNNITKTVAAGSTDVFTRLTTAPFPLAVGDSVWLDSVSGTDEFVTITAISLIPSGISHIAIGTPMVAGDHVRRGYVSDIAIIQATVPTVGYLARYGRDYTNTLLAGGVVGFTFSTSMEADLGIPETLQPNDMVFCTVFGKQNDVTLGGSPYGGNNVNHGNLTDGFVILFDLLKKMGVPESEIDLVQFAGISGGTDVSFVIAEGTEDFPLYKDIIVTLLQTLLVKLCVNDENEMALNFITKNAPLTADKTIADDEILRGSISFNIDYSDIVSNITVEYQFKERTDNINKVYSSSDIAMKLHGVNKTKVIRSYHLEDADAQSYADMIMAIFGERKGTLELRTKNRFFDTILSDVIEVDRTKLPGFPYDGETLNSRKFSILETEKTLKDVRILLDDQKGIEDSSIW